MDAATIAAKTLPAAITGPLCYAEMVMANYFKVDRALADAVALSGVGRFATFTSGGFATFITTDFGKAVAAAC